jgi:pyruvate dehydrogenase E2 component (dihydrolipoamide acetyltransferase)
MSAIKAITMPKWGMEMSEGVISDWHVSIGDTITAGDDLVDVETSKIVNTVTATDSGILRAIIGNTGDTLAVGATIGVIADASASDDDVQAFVAQLQGSVSQPVAAVEQTESATAAPVAAVQSEQPAKVEAAATKPVTNTDQLAALAAGDDDSSVYASPVARRLAKQYGVNLNNLSATGHHGRVSKQDVDNAFVAAGGQLAVSTTATTRPRPPQDDSQVKATPVARRLAKQRGINLNDCRSSGDRGRVCKADVDALSALTQPVASAEKPAVAPQASDAADNFDTLPMTGMRKTIAARLQSSKQTAPHFRVHIDAEIDALLAVRKQINAANSNAKVSVNDFIVKACAAALLKIPAVNVQFDGEVIKQFKDADIAVAVAIDDGLITPIVRAANNKGLMAISNTMRDLATRAKIGRLKAEEFQGGTFCVSNLGMFGVKQFDAIINPPQGAILAVGAGEQRAVIKDGQVACATVMSLTLSSDHRIIDGAVAAQFMAELKGFLEQPATMLG